MLSEAEVSQIAALRKTNTYPSQERDHLCEVLRSSRKHSLMLAETISQLEAKLPALAKEKDAVDALISDLSVILHPARTIPHEILSEIFTLVTLSSAAPTNESLCGRIFQDSLDPSYPSWVLSKVSSSWRRAALHINKCIVDHHRIRRLRRIEQHFIVLPVQRISGAVR